MTRLHQSLWNHLISLGDHKAIDSDIGQLSYQQLKETCVKLVQNLTPLKQKQIGIWSPRTLSTYPSILGTFLAGKTYVPLSPENPGERNQSIIDQAGIRVVLVGTREDASWSSFCSLIKTKLIILYLDELDFDGRDDELSFDHIDEKDLAYLLFTSGSTGKPKGVGISYENLSWYLKHLGQYYTFEKQDRFSQTFEFSFDLSVHDLFVCWYHGATLCPMSLQDKLFAGAYIERQKISVWFSVPTMAAQMDQLGSLQPNSYPYLRYSLFCGEAFPVNLAQKWQTAAVNSTVENLYGPTEATIAFTRFRYQGEHSKDSKNGILSIGRPFSGLDFWIKDTETGELHREPGLSGELVLAGNQVANGYWKDKEKSKQSFFKHNGLDCYLTGDRVELDQDGNLFFLGRLDQQIKFQGHRIELTEIEYHLKAIIGSEKAVVIGHPVDDLGKIEALVGVIESHIDRKETEIIELMRTRLAPYMVPKRIIKMGSLPINTSGKVDRKKIYQLLTDS